MLDRSVCFVAGVIDTPGSFVGSFGGSFDLGLGLGVAGTWACCLGLGAGAL